MTAQKQPRVRQRARQACMVCNARRVKCNVTEAQPCGNCVVANARCEVRPSRRGKRNHRPKQKDSGSRNAESHARDSIILRTGFVDDGDDDYDDDIELPDSVNNGKGLGARDERRLQSSASSVPAVRSSANFNHQLGSTEPFNYGTSASSAEKVNANYYQGGSTVSIDRCASPNPAASADTNFDNVEPTIQLNNGTSSPNDAIADDDSEVFLGESSSLRYVQNEETPSSVAFSPPNEAHRFRFPISQAARADSILPEWEAQRKSKRIESLKKDGAFSLPSASICDALLQAYFTWFHPCFPILDRAEVMEAYLNRSLSPLLLQSMLFVGVLHSDTSLLLEKELGGREKARYGFYNRAKDIYDSDFESHQLVVIQALFLMSFWRAGPLLEKDSRHWLGAAISLAQSKAMHRAGANSDQKHTKLRKRIWWSIYIRERQCAAALGLPHRIRDEDCDVPSLEVTDFEQIDPSSSTSIKSSSQPEDSILYVIEMVKLAKFLGKIVHTAFLPNKSMDHTTTSQLKDLLIAWKRDLPRNMQLGGDFGESSSPGFYTNLLHLAYNNLLILLYRSAFIGDNPNTIIIPSSSDDGTIALRAATLNSRIVEDMLSSTSSQSTIQHGHIHTITNLFNTLCIHTIHMRRCTGTARSVAEHRAKLCLLGLQELQKTWDVTNWVLQLFFRYLDGSTARSLRMAGGGEEGLETMQQQQSGNKDVAAAAGRLDPSSSSATTTTAATLNIPTTAITRTNPQPLIPPTTSITTTSSSYHPPWTPDQIDTFLFSQIQNDFAFGEGGFGGGSGGPFLPYGYAAGGDGPGQGFIGFE